MDFVFQAAHLAVIDALMSVSISNSASVASVTKAVRYVGEFSCLNCLIIVVITNFC
jgi:hypothetical protein